MTWCTGKALPLTVHLYSDITGFVSRSVRPSSQVEDSGLGSKDNSCQEMETQETGDTDILSPDL